MPDETTKLASPAEFLPSKLKKGQHTSATMKAHLQRKARVPLPNGESATIQASSIIFNGQIITDPEDVPTDKEIEAHNEEVIARRSRQS